MKHEKCDFVHFDGYLLPTGSIPEKVADNRGMRCRRGRGEYHESRFVRLVFSESLQVYAKTFVSQNFSTFAFCKKFPRICKGDSNLFAWC